MNVFTQLTAGTPPGLLATPRSGGVLRRGLSFIAREPFFQFMALGFVLWFAMEHLQALHSRYTIHIGEAQRAHLTALYQQQYSRFPSSAQLQELLDRYVTEEIFLREGQALNLDQDDEIVRRRIAQKFEFLQADVGVPKEPTGTDLDQWYAQHQDRYLTPEQFSFSQIYFSTDRNGAAVAHERAVQALTALQGVHTDSVSQFGDSFPGPAEIVDVAQDGAERIFGKSDLTDHLAQAPLNTWAGPFRSGYGWHLIYLMERRAPVTPLLSEIRSKVRDDYVEAERQASNAANLVKLRHKYAVVYDEAQP